MTLLKRSFGVYAWFTKNWTAAQNGKLFHFIHQNEAFIRFFRDFDQLHINYTVLSQAPWKHLMSFLSSPCRQIVLPLSLLFDLVGVLWSKQACNRDSGGLLQSLLAASKATPICGLTIICHILAWLACCYKAKVWKEKQKLKINTSM